MAALPGPFAVLFLGLSCLGAGWAALAALGLREKLADRERDPLAFALGVGLLGWAAFFPALAGLLDPGALTALAAPGLGGLALRRRARPAAVAAPLDAVMACGVALLGAIAIIDLAQALAPPADADTLAYHFALPKQFLRDGRLVFVPRAIDGAAPLLLHMTYLAALGIGGETALTLWVMVLGWAAAWLLHAIARDHLDRRSALALTLVFLTTPAAVFGAGSGQLEMKLALFASAAALAAARALRSGNARFAILAGFYAGFYVGAKYTGPIFAGACGLVLIRQRAWLRHGGLFAASVVAAGWQWYWWNFANSGDPMFPVLFDWLGAGDHLWSAANQAFLRQQYLPEENPAPATLFWLLAYPVLSILDGMTNWDSGRTGLGPFALLILPMALAGAWRLRRRAAASELASLALIAALFYVLWFMSASSQRVRHLLPVYPAVLLCLAVAARRLAEARRLTNPFAGAMLLTLVVQSGGLAVFGLNYLRHLASGESREAFLMRNVGHYAPVPWINAHLKAPDRLLFTDRQLAYYLEVPSFMAIQRNQHLVDLLPGASDPRRFRDELRRLGITHILLVPSLAGVARGEQHIFTQELASYTAALAAAGCAAIIHSAAMTAPHSRTLPTLAFASVSSDVLSVDPEHCRLPGDG